MDEAAEGVAVRMRIPRTMPRGCPRRPESASIGPSEVRGWSKQAKTSVDFSSRLLASVLISSKPSKMACTRKLMPVDQEHPRPQSPAL